MYNRTSESLPAIYVNARRIHQLNNSDGGGALPGRSGRMTLSTSRQQFLASESRDCALEYERKGGCFVTRCVCCLYVLLAVAAAVITGVVAFYLGREKSIFTSTNDIWSSETDTLELSPSPDLRLPKSVMPSFYRLKLVPNLKESTFSGEVYITLKTKESNVKQIILHSNGLNINTNGTKITEQVYESIQTHPGRFRRQTNANNTNNVPDNHQGIVSNSTVESNSKLVDAITVDNKPKDAQTNENILDNKHAQNKAQNKSFITPSESAKEEITVKNYAKKNLNQYSDDLMKLSAVIIPKVGVQVTRSNTRKLSIASVKTDAKTQRLIVNLGSALKPNIDYTLELVFNGNITDSLKGFYKSSYVDAEQKTKELVITQFEPTSARSAFPCFDEPEFKATFEISIAHSDNLTVLSNMPVASKEPMSAIPGWSWSHFNRSVKMSTYLVAYGIVDFNYLETAYLSTDNTTKTIRVWARKELIEQAKYALSITPKILTFYEKWFGLPYALEKLDLIAIPDFSSGAMENWGLITFREVGLLYDDNSNSTSSRQNVAIDIAHELAHQWFGNLVTMAWWNDLWLNEGFATYLQHIGVDHVEPEWKMLESLSEMKMSLLRTDALQHTSPVSQPVNDVAEIQQKFDEISYNKAASLIRWLNHTITEQIFKRGLVNYLNEWKFDNAREDDLWSAMSEAASSAQESLLRNISLVRFMDSWSSQAGYPVVSAILDYATHKLTFRQNLFSTVPTSKSRQKQIWRIPISYTMLGGVNASEWDTKPKIWLQDREATVNLPMDDKQALYVNVDSIGYYRVNYDARNWRKLSDVLLTRHETLPALSRAQLVDDAFNLAKAGLLPYQTALELTTYLTRETEKIVLELSVGNLDFILLNFKNTPYRGDFEDYILHLIEPMLRRHSYGVPRPASDHDALLLEFLLTEECLCGAPRCVRWATGLFEQWMNASNVADNPIPTSYRPLVYSEAIRHGGRDEFEFLWRVARNSTDPNDQVAALGALSSSRDESLIILLLERSLSEVDAQDLGAVWEVSASAAPVTQRFLVDNWARVHAKYSHMDPFVLASVINGAFNYIFTKRDLDMFKGFVEEHYEELAPYRQSLLKLADSASLKINWLEKYASRIADWVKRFHKRSDKNAMLKGTSKAEDQNKTTDFSPASTPQRSKQDSVPINTALHPTVTADNNVKSRVVSLASNPQISKQDTVPINKAPQSQLAVDNNVKTTVFSPASSAPKSKQDSIPMSIAPTPQLTADNNVKTTVVSPASAAPKNQTDSGSMSVALEPQLIANNHTKTIEDYSASTAKTSNQESVSSKEVPTSQLIDDKNTKAMLDLPASTAQISKNNRLSNEEALNSQPIADKNTKTIADSLERTAEISEKDSIFNKEAPNSQLIDNKNTKPLVDSEFRTVKLSNQDNVSANVAQKSQSKADKNFKTGVGSLSSQISKQDTISDYEASKPQLQADSMKENAPQGNTENKESTNLSVANSAANE